MTELPNLPILDFDPTVPAIIEPSVVIPRADVPHHLVLCFFQEVIDALVATHDAKIVHTLRSEVREFPMYEISFKGQRLAFMHPGVGAPLSAGLMEEAIAMGCGAILACGGCGVLDRNLAVGHLLLPIAAVRDEGTSYHYLPPAPEVQANPVALSAIENVLEKMAVPYLKTKTWTTDAFYRETPARVARYKAAGCLTVEMEAAALMAVAQFRGVTFGQILYGGDTVIEGAWDRREWHTRTEIRENLFWLAAEACLNLPDRSVNA
ncbi:MAG TPA: nucleoside phosphorylase [Anaerolineaceae bacterium]|jgi:uridine phosphorylase|nr:nucleoside phosphorylase [Anaerolineaceae bacterium]HPT23576.1 nucleoside phosphorylase [Anaerolineaceae bacterium]